MGGPHSVALFVFHGENFAAPWGGGQAAREPLTAPCGAPAPSSPGRNAKCGWQLWGQARRKPHGQAGAEGTWGEGLLVPSTPKAWQDPSGCSKSLPPLPEKSLRSLLEPLRGLLPKRGNRFGEGEGKKASAGTPEDSRA